MTPETVIPTYDRAADAFARQRDKTLYERTWLDRALTHAPGRRVLDIGCGTGRPIATYLADRRATVTGVDAAPGMLAHFRTALPAAEAVEADMRRLNLGRVFDIVLAWNSLFHLPGPDQRAMFPIFAAHAAPRAVLLFTSGPAADETTGTVDGAEVYHASLPPDDYEALLTEAGFELLAFIPEDPSCRGHSVWMARRLPD